MNRDILALMETEVSYEGEWGHLGGSRKVMHPGLDIPSLVHLWQTPYVFTYFWFILLPATQLDYISQPPLQLGEIM